MTAFGKTKVFVLCGPTCTGKTSLALDLCKKFNGEIISADSRQIYKFMDVGTGKEPVVVPDSGLVPTIVKQQDRWVINDISIWGYDLVEPDKDFSSYNFAQFALKKIAELITNGKTVFIVGGTGFYIDILTGRMTPSNVNPDPELRKELEVLSLAELNRRLMSLNLERYKTIDQKNKVRLSRAVEIELSQKEKVTPLPYLSAVDYVSFGLTSSNETLYKRADAWAETIWHNGIIEETTKLIELGYANTPRLHGLIYKSVCDYIAGSVTESEALLRCKYDLHAYIRRQLTWFKKNPQLQWFDIATPVNDNISHCLYNNV
jgi:tRNA dimethylallyltransferase